MTFDGAGLPNTANPDALRLLETARELRPLLQKWAPWVEVERRIPDEVAEKLEAAGMWHMRRPRELGGFALTMRESAEICEELGRGCPSTAYMTAMLNGNDGHHAPYPQETQDEYWSDVNARACVIFAPSSDARRVDGGWILSGQWSYATGALNASWADVAFKRTNEQGDVEGVSFALIPISELEIVDTWHVVALVGSGSFSVVAKEIFVPDARTYDFTGFLNAFPAFGVYASLSVSGSIIGMADGMFNAVLEKLAQDRPIAHSSYKRAKDSPSMQLNLADAAQLIDGARMHYHRACDDLDNAIAEARELSIVERGRIRADVGSAARLIREAAELLLNIGGPSAFTIASPIQRHWRDLELASRHGYINSDIAREAYGRALVGLNTDSITATV